MLKFLTRKRAVEVAPAFTFDFIPTETQAVDLEDFFGCLLSGGHTLEEAIAGVRDYAAGRFEPTRG